MRPQADDLESLKGDLRSINKFEATARNTFYYIKGQNQNQIKPAAGKVQQKAETVRNLASKPKELKKGPKFVK